MSNVLLIRPQQIRWKIEAKRVATPLGLLSIASVLRQNGHEVHLIDAAIEGYDSEREIKKDIIEFGLTQSELERRIHSISPDIVGIQSSLTCYWEQARNAARAVKDVNPDIKVVFGGQHSTGTAEEIMEMEPSIDYVVKGEGEQAFIQLLEIQDRKTATHEKIFHGSMADLKLLPEPAFDLLKPNDYSPQMSHFGKPRGKNFITNVVTRGCPMGCAYCTSSHYFGRAIRHYSLEQIESQVNTIKSMGFEEYISMDDNILMLQKEIRNGFFRILKKSGLPWVLDGGLYYSSITEEFVSEIAENGCYRAFMPIENPDIEIMHKYDKYKNLNSTEEQKKRIHTTTKLFEKYCVEFYSAIMIGFPGESWQSIMNAIKFSEELRQMGTFAVGFHWVHPYPFTPFYNSSYGTMPESRRWQSAPEYYTFIKPVFTIESITLEWAEQYVNEKAREINKTSLLNNSYRYGESDWHSIG